LTWQRTASRLRRFQTTRGESPDEEDVPAESTSPEQDAWLPSADEDTGGTERAEAAAREGAQAPHRLEEVWNGHFPTLAIWRGANASGGRPIFRRFFSGGVEKSGGALWCSGGCRVEVVELGSR
jgi:hypothetical protein